MGNTEGCIDLTNKNINIKNFEKINFEPNFFKEKPKFTKFDFKLKKKKSKNNEKMKIFLNGNLVFGKNKKRVFVNLIDTDIIKKGKFLIKNDTFKENFKKTKFLKNTKNNLNF